MRGGTRSRLRQWTDPLAQPSTNAAAEDGHRPVKAEELPPGARMGPREAPRAANRPAPAAAAAAAARPLDPAAASPASSGRAPDTKRRSVSPNVIPPYVPPTFKNGSEGSRSPSPNKRSNRLPCVAHPVYTKHQNCGCFDSPSLKRSDSRTGSVAAEKPASPPPEPVPVAEVVEAVVEPPPGPTFADPILIGSIPGQIRGVSVLKGGRVILGGDKALGVATRQPFSGEVIKELVAGSKSSPSVVRRIERSTWIGFQDGSVRVYNDSGAVVREYKAHTATVTDIAACDGSVYSCSADRRVLLCSNTTQRNGKGATSEFATNGTALTSMASITILREDATMAPMLVTGDTSGTLTAYFVRTPEQASDRSFTIPAHSKAVSSLMTAGTVLWSGCEDGSVKVWDLRARSTVRSLGNVQPSGVASMQRHANHIWILGRDAQCAVVDATSGSELFRTTFGTKEAPSITKGTALHHIMPVEGQLLWYCDAKGETTSWYFPAPVEKRDVEGSPESTADSLRDFERSEAISLLEERVVKDIASVESLVDGRLIQMRRALDESLAHMTEEGEATKKRWLAERASRAQDEDNVATSFELEESQRRVADLEAELADSKANAAEMRQALEAAGEQDAKLRAEIAEAKRGNDNMKSVTNAEFEEFRALRAAQKAREVERKDWEAQQNEWSEERKRLHAELKSLRQSKDSGSSSAQSQLDSVRAELQETLRRENQAQQEATKLRGEVKALEDAKQALQSRLKHADEASKKKVRAPDDVAEIARLEAEANTLKSEVARYKRAADEANLELQRERLGKREADAKASEGKGQLEQKLAAMAVELEALRASSSRAAALEDDNRGLRETLKTLDPKRVQELNAEIEQLHKQLSTSRHHITRLLESEMSLKGRIETLTERAQASEARARKATQRGASPNRKGSSAGRSASASSAASPEAASPRRPSNYIPPCDPSDPNHRKNCMWCNGSINVSAGGTFGVAAPFYGQSLLRAPSLGPVREVWDGRSASSPPRMHDIIVKRTRGSSEPVRTDGPFVSPRKERSKDPVAPTTNPLLDASPQDRLRVLEQARDAAVDQQVRASLVEEILAIHKSLEREKADKAQQEDQAKAHEQ